MSELYNADINKGIFYAKIEKFQRIKMIFHLSIYRDEMQGIFVCNISQKKMGKLFSENS